MWCITCRLSITMAPPIDSRPSLTSKYKCLTAEFPRIFTLQHFPYSLWDDTKESILAQLEKIMSSKSATHKSRRTYIGFQREVPITNTDRITKQLQQYFLVYRAPTELDRNLSLRFRNTLQTKTGHNFDYRYVLWICFLLCPRSACLIFERVFYRYPLPLPQHSLI